MTVIFISSSSVHGPFRLKCTLQFFFSASDIFNYLPATIRRRWPRPVCARQTHHTVNSRARIIKTESQSLWWTPASNLALLSNLTSNAHKDTLPDVQCCNVQVEMPLQVLQGNKWSNPPPQRSSFRKKFSLFAADYWSYLLTESKIYILWNKNRSTTYKPVAARTFYIRLGIKRRQLHLFVS